MKYRVVITMSGINTHGESLRFAAWDSVSTPNMDAFYCVFNSEHFIKLYEHCKMQFKSVETVDIEIRRGE